MKTTISWLLAVSAAGLTLWGTEIFYEIVSSSGQVLYPFPGLYFIEIRALGFLAITAVTIKSPRWALLPWNLVGIYLVLIILGMWSIGRYLIPAALITLILAFIMSTKFKIESKEKYQRLIYSALGQIAFMYAVILLRV